jgi:hypothetical protein
MKETQWEEVISRWVEDRRSVSISEAFSLSRQTTALWTQVDKNRVARCFRALGWKRYRERHGARLEWRYRRVEA